MRTVPTTDREVVALMRCRIGQPSFPEFHQLLHGYLTDRLPPGCAGRHAYVEVDVPSAYCLLERWTDARLLSEHLVSDDHRALRGGMRALGLLEGEEVLHPGAAAGGGAPQLLQLVAHDLRNPLASITALVSLVEEALAGAPGRSGEAEDLRLVRAECARMARMLSDLTVVSCDEQRLVAAREPVAVKEVLRDAARLVESQAIARGVAVGVDLAGAPDVAALDPALVRRLLDNLAANAVRHVRPGDRIELAARAEGDRLRLAVRNTGPEVPERVQQRLAGAPATVEGGTGATRGLGLHVCRLVAEAHGGFFALIPRAGWTVSFEAVLPAGASSVTAA